jgi:diacylglycerol O-acyltransferase / wax synthase
MRGNPPVSVSTEVSPRRAGQHEIANGATSRHRLSPVDAAFLYLERPELPLNIASVSIFDGPIPFDKFVASIESKLALVPRYRQRVAMPPFNLGLPTWEEDRDFDIRQHIFRVRLERPGGDAELEALAGRILSQLMDRSKPLWDIHVIDGLKDGRGALIWRLHHALADGVSGAGTLSVMLDPTPEGSRVVHKAHLGRRPSKPAEPSLTDAVSDMVQSTMDGLMTAEKGVFGFAQSLVTGPMQNGLKELVDLLPELAESMERLPFNRPCGTERKFCWADLDLARIQAVREALGGTVNDVILTIVTRALARYTKLHGESIVNRFVRVVCPVSLRNGGSNGELGNQISFLPVALPLDVRSPARMLEAVAKRTSTMKHAGAAGWVALAGGCIAAMPTPLQALLWRGLPELILPVSLFNLICTNVPGSPVPLYAVGRRMIAAYPQVPTGWDLGVGCAVQSYNGKLCFGLIADAIAGSDVNRLRDLLYVAFQELCRAAGLRDAGITSARKVQPRGASRSARNPKRRDHLRTAAPRAQKLSEAISTAPGPDLGAA